MNTDYNQDWDKYDIELYIRSIKAHQSDLEKQVPIILGGYEKHNNLADTLYITRNKISDVCASAMSQNTFQDSFSQLYGYMYSMLFRIPLFKDTLNYFSQDSHDQGGARSSPCLLQSQSKLNSFHEGPVSRKEVFCCQKEEVTLWVPFHFQKQATCQHTMLGHGDSNIRPKLGLSAGLTSRWQVSNLGTLSCLRLRHLLWLTEHDTGLEQYDHGITLFVIAHINL